jgi:glycosyltransferase involved in cell wall biosynthesis
MNDLSVSIIIPVYQVEDYIERCIESIIRQTYDHSKIECILIDDCGPDQSICLAKRCIDEYKGDIHFIIVHNEHNCGQSESRNNGLNIATNSYVYFLDSDDYLTSDCIEKLVSVIRDNPKVEVVMANHIDKRNGKSISTNRIPRTMINNKELMKLFFLATIPCMVWNLLISRALIERGHLRFKSGIVYEDNLWSFKLFRDVNSFVFISDITLIYEMNPHSIVNNDEQKEDERRLKSLVIVLNELYNNIDSCNYEGIIIYMTTLLLGLIDRMNNNKSDVALRKEASLIRNMMLKRTFRDCRFILFTFVFFMCHIIRISFFRKQYQRISHCVFYISSIFSPLHTIFR